MKKSLLTLMSAAVLFASCSKNDNKENGTVCGVRPTQTAAAKSAQPFTGQITYHFTMDYDLPCDCGSYYPAGNFYGTGNLTHLGASSSRIKPCLSPIFSGTTQIGDHVGVECASFVAANGDELYMYTHPYDLMYSGSVATGTCNVDFAGGTGRFAGATGSFTGTVTVHPATGMATLTDINGTINY
ncbi:MAG: hypothetical protein V4649_05400 [Bacteroidota bacterium]